MVLPLGDLEKTRIVPYMTYGLIALNVLTYLFQLDSSRSLEVAYAATPYEISHNVDLDQPVTIEVDDDREPDGSRTRVVPEVPGPRPIWLTLFTAMFLHGSPIHLAGNMLFLWIFGDNVEEVLGPVIYLVVYLACGLIGSMVQIAAQPDSLIPTLGASGAIAGVMGMYVSWFPRNRVRVLVFRYITELPAIVVVGCWLGIQFWWGVGSIRHPSASGGVAYLAHVGGAATGLLSAWFFHDRAAFIRKRNLADDGWFYGPP